MSSSGRFIDSNRRDSLTKSARETVTPPGHGAWLSAQSTTFGDQIEFVAMDGFGG
jgi:hypothetical protein